MLLIPVGLWLLTCIIDVNIAILKVGIVDYQVLDNKVRLLLQLLILCKLANRSGEKLRIDRRLHRLRINIALRKGLCRLIILKLLIYERFFGVLPKLDVIGTLDLADVLFSLDLLPCSKGRATLIVIISDRIRD